MMEKFKFILRKNINRLPKEPGVYCFKNENEILYIGKAANIRERVKNHFEQPTYKDYLFLDKVKKIGYIKTNSEIEALILEANLIKKIKPKFNVLWKDDKNYFFVGITKEDFPVIFITHQPKLKTKTCKLSTEFVGPFVDGKSLKSALKILRKVFPFRSCKKLPKRPCLWYYLERCPGPCILTKKPERTKEIKKISQESAKKIMKFLKEGGGKLIKELKKEMQQLAKKEQFEEAAKVRDQIFALERVIEHAKIFEVKNENQDWDQISSFLEKLLKIEGKISRIEAFDISCIQGKLATGSMVTFLEGKAEKNLYRKFKIKMAGKPNDLLMLREVLERRLKHKEWGLPELILIDGGKAHLNVAKEVKEKEKETQKIKVISFAKGKEEIFIENQKRALPLKSLPQKVANFIVRVDREAHRFALSYHKKLREKELKI